MSAKRILTVQDISCVGQCSLTVALPILSVCGLEGCILPTALLSNHTAERFHGFTFHDLTGEMPAIIDRWSEEGLLFDAIYTGYLGSCEQIGHVQDAMRRCLRKGAPRIIDPAMADHGRLYAGFDMAFVQAMKGLCAQADYLLPNMTEACLLTDTPYAEQYDEARLQTLCEGLHALGAANVILTGVSPSPCATGVWISQSGRAQMYLHERVPGSRHGTGDIFASAFTGLLLAGMGAPDAAKGAADFTLRCIRATRGDEAHWYGVHFEQELPALLESIRGMDTV